MGGFTSQGPVPVTLSSIILDPDAWPRARRDEDRVALFANLYEEGGAQAIAPIEVCQQGDVLLCSDGAHRIAAAEIAGLDVLPAFVIEVDEEDDLVTVAFIHAIGASTKGHKELTRAERQSAIRRLASETDLSDIEIAELFGVTRQTVWRTRNRVADATRESVAQIGDEYVAFETAYDAAVKLFRGLDKVYEARGLGVWDALTGDHTGERLAQVLLDVYDEDALARAEQFRTWCHAAVRELGGRS